ncbi:MAG TPA: hypothetical protein VMV46_10430, partial [Thermoanaerobaculia bacterium]|nr:hypothetical protein [Thermoanaerobaculia bacterium]
MRREPSDPATTRTAPPPRSRGRGAPARLAALLALGAAALATAQPVARYDDAIEVRLVNLDALVVDRQ